MFLLRCPECKHTMKYQPTKVDLKGLSKRCVYCGKSFNVKNSIEKQIEK
jgi:transposase-like protein